MNPEVSPSVDAVDAVLCVSVATGLVLLDTTHVPMLEELRGHTGATFHAPDEVDLEEGSSMGHSRVINRAVIDIGAVLRHAVGAFGFEVGEEFDGFIRLKRADLPNGVAAFFAARALPLYAIVPRGGAQLTVVVHVCDGVDDATYNEFAHPLGVHVLRLRDLAAFDVAEIEVLRSTLVALRSAVEPSGAVEEEQAPPGLDLTKVAEYARTQEDALFEWATAAILAPLVSRTFRFGNAFRGSPVPDGLLIESAESLLYDCKSKKADDYGLSPKDADQQNRYLPILDRLKSATPSIVGRAVVLFTPDVDQATFDAQVQKEFWNKIVDSGFQLIVVPATCLAALHALHAGEDSASAFFDRAAFWRALLHQELVGIGDDSGLTHLLGDRARRRRLLRVSDVEIAWLSAVLKPPTDVKSVSEAIAPVDPKSNLGTRVKRPAVIRKFFAELRQRGPTVASIAAATGLSERAVEYLLISEQTKNDLSLDELGDNGAKNLRLLIDSVTGD